MTAALTASLRSVAAVDADFYVAPNGSDTNPGTLDRPFASIARARDAVSAMPKSRDIVVLLRGGTYILDKTIEFSPDDSGSSQGRVIYSAYPGEAPVLSGGRRIAGWTKLADALPDLSPQAKGQVWVADVPKGWRFHQLLVNGRPQRRATRPDTDDWQTWPRIKSVGKLGPDGQPLKFPAGSLDGVSGTGDVDVCFLPSYRWMNQLFVLRDVNRQDSTGRRHSRNITYVGAAGDPFRIENALIALDQPGEWCVDSTLGRVYYWPPSGTMQDVEAVGSVLHNLVRFQGDEAAGRVVHHVELRGLSFTCADRPPEDEWSNDWLIRNFECPQAAVFMQGVEDCAIEGGRFTHLAAYAVALDHHAQRVRIVANEMSYLGCGGVQIYGYGPGTRDVNRQNLISRNHIHHIGLSYWHSGAISVHGSGSNRITQNYIHDLPYVGIMICGVFAEAFNKPWLNYDSEGRFEGMFNIRWDELPPGSRERFNASAGTFTREGVKPFQHSGDNVVENNIVINAMQTLHDGGALYAFSCGLNNVWRRNVVHDGKDTTYLFPLYMDDEVDGAVLEGNAVWSPGHPMNKGANRWTDNTIAGDRTPQYTGLLKEIVDSVRKDGGWPGANADEVLDR